MIFTRRSALIGASASLIAAPAIVRAASLMPVRAITKMAGMRALYVHVNGGVSVLLQDAEDHDIDLSVLGWSDRVGLNHT
jgi:hypothetical protein